MGALGGGGGGVKPSTEHARLAAERFEARPVLWICTGFTADPDPDTGFDDQNLLNLQLKKTEFFLK
jgi:hypothetical protein